MNVRAKAVRRATNEEAASGRKSVGKTRPWLILRGKKTQKGRRGDNKTSRWGRKISITRGGGQKNTGVGNEGGEKNVGGDDIRV